MRFCTMVLFIFSLAFCSAFGQERANVKAIIVTFTTIDVPGAVYTGVFGINSAGIMVGNYGQNTLNDSHGFMYSNGAFTYFDYPGESITVPTGINDSNLVVGFAGSGTILGFLYDGITFTTITDGNNSATYADGIDNAGDVVGGAGTIYTTKGFEMRSGKFKTLNVPGHYTYNYGNGINNFGTIVGWTESDGFICRGNNCKIMDYPGAVQTEALGINDGGVVVGWYTSTGGTWGFASKNGKYISFGFPGAAFTGAEGINNSGQIVGAYTFDYQAWHGFVTNPITAADVQ